MAPVTRHGAQSAARTARAYKSSMDLAARSVGKSMRAGYSTMDTPRVPLRRPRSRRRRPRQAAGEALDGAPPELCPR
eukprot:11193574-Lingulodinium_polyedra.AAC.1